MSWISVGEPLAPYACFEQNSGGVSPNHSVLSLFAGACKPSRTPNGGLIGRYDSPCVSPVCRVFCMSVVQQHPWNEDSGKGKQRCSFS